MKKQWMSAAGFCALALYATAAQATDAYSNLWLERARHVGFNPEILDGKSVYCRSYTPIGSHILKHECVTEAKLIENMMMAPGPTPSLQILSGRG